MNMRHDLEILDVGIPESSGAALNFSFHPVLPLISFLSLEGGHYCYHCHAIKMQKPADALHCININ